MQRSNIKSDPRRTLGSQTYHTPSFHSFYPSSLSISCYLVQALGAICPGAPFCPYIIHVLLMHPSVHHNYLVYKLEDHLVYFLQLNHAPQPYLQTHWIPHFFIGACWTREQAQRCQHCNLLYIPWAWTSWSFPQHPQHDELPLHHCCNRYSGVTQYGLTHRVQAHPESEAGSGLINSWGGINWMRGAGGVNPLLQFLTFYVQGHWLEVALNL